MTDNPLGLALLAVVGLGVFGLLGWAGYCFARWYRADAETRVSLRQARRLRWGCKRLAPMLGLAVKDATPTVLQQYGPQEQPAKPRVLVPCLRTRADAFGVTVTADALPQIGLSAWQDASEGLCDAWGMRRIRISQPKPGVIVARGFRREPLEAVIRSPLLGPDGSPACRPGQFVSTDDVLLGWDEDGTPIVLNLAYSAHALVAGLTRSGKSITVNTLLAYASLMRDVRLIVIDPNLGAVAP
ncbi:MULTISPECIES: FtsK/SpoIIIE domain-containing protein [unclassified Streptomyces]|uniref:FtsK/SpoIIIE domain-containing protein n=1 Tax=unclassified Streptomyces TaxID=2593676 RepID=UPI0006B0183C|nr:MULTISPECIES: FtsK/SpoIIIE domain-containing protein [unclassified Streptomyces]